LSATPIIPAGPVVGADVTPSSKPTSGVDAAQTRSDVDTLAAKVVALAASGDGVESGFTTSEFWLTALAVVADFTGPYWGFRLSPNEQILAASGLVLGYGAYRTWRKNGGAARLIQRINAIRY